MPKSAAPATPSCTPQHPKTNLPCTLKCSYFHKSRHSVLTMAELRQVNVMVLGEWLVIGQPTLYKISWHMTQVDQRRTIELAVFIAHQSTMCRAPAQAGTGLTVHLHRQQTCNIRAGILKCKINVPYKEGKGLSSVTSILSNNPREE